MITVRRIRSPLVELHSRIRVLKIKPGITHTNSAVRPNNKYIDGLSLKKEKTAKPQQAMPQIMLYLNCAIMPVKKVAKPVRNRMITMAMYSKPAKFAHQAARLAIKKPFHT